MGRGSSEHTEAESRRGGIANCCDMVRGLLWFSQNRGVKHKAGLFRGKKLKVSPAKPMKLSPHGFAVESEAQPPLSTALSIGGIAGGNSKGLGFPTGPTPPGRRCSTAG